MSLPVIVAIAIVGALVVIGLAGYLLRRRRELARNRAHAVTVIAPVRERAQLTARRRSNIEDRADRVADQVDGATIERLVGLREAYDEAKAEFDDRHAKIEALDGAAVGGLSFLGVRTAISDANMLGRALDRLEPRATSLDAAVADLEEAPERMRIDREELAASRESIAAAIAARRDEGWKVESFEESLRQIDGRLDALAARSDDAKLDADAIRDDNDRLVLDLRGLADGVTGLESRRDQLSARADQLANAVAGQRKRLNEGRVLIDGWRSIHGAGDYYDLEGHPDAADELLVQATEELVSVRDAGAMLSMEQQRWDEAESTMDGCRALLDQADDLLGAIDKRDSSLIEAVETAAAAASDARFDHSEFVATMGRNRRDLDSSFDSVAALAATLVEQAEAELERPKPEYLQALRMATDASTNLTSARETAGEVADRAESHRAAARRAVSNARVAVRNVAKYHRRSLFSSWSRFDDDVARLETRFGALNPDLGSSAVAAAERLSREADNLYAEIRLSREVND